MQAASDAAADTARAYRLFEIFICYSHKSDVAAFYEEARYVTVLCSFIAFLLLFYNKYVKKNWLCNPRECYKVCYFMFFIITISISNSY